MGDFTVTLVGKSGKFTTEIQDALDFDTYPHEVCLSEMLFAPGSWDNVRSKSNWFLLVDTKTKVARTCSLPPKNYVSVEEIFHAINVEIDKVFGYESDFFFYETDKKMCVFPYWRHGFGIMGQGEDAEDSRHDGSVAEAYNGG